MKRINSIFIYLFFLCLAIISLAASPMSFSFLVVKSDCTTITSGACLDSDDGILYVWDGDSVEKVTSTTLTDIDDLPGDTTDNDKIDGAILGPISEQAVTCSDSGDGSPGTLTITPTAGVAHETVAITVSDSDGCTVTMAETGAVEDTRVILHNESAANTATFTTAANVLTLKLGSPYAMGAKEDLDLIYANSEWLELGRSGAWANVTIGGGTARSDALFDESGELASIQLSPMQDDCDNFNANFTGDYLYGGTFVCNAAGTCTLPAVGAGMHFSIITEGAVQCIVDPNASDSMLTDGAQQADGENITNTSTSGDMAVIQYFSAAGWLVQTDGWTQE